MNITNEQGGWIIPAGAVVEEKSIPSFSIVGEGTKFGNGTKFGDWTTFGNKTSFGSGTKFGKDTTYSEFPCRKIATMSNIDGTGRQIVCVIGEDLCMIEAGCFWGTLKEFVAKARSEDKLLYASCVSSFCKAMLKALKENKQEKNI